MDADSLSPGRGGRRRPALLSTGLVSSVLVLVVAGLAVAQEDAPPPFDDGQIAGWIEQLASDQFAKREAATRSLVGAGEAAIGPLRAAIGKNDLEVSSRAVEILRELLAGEDPEVTAAAEQALEWLTEVSDPAVAGMAEATLDFHMVSLVEAAREKLVSLGAVITEGFMTSGRRGTFALINNTWKGKAEDLRLLTRLRGVLQVGVHGIRLDDAGIGTLGRLRGVEQLQLFGTGLDDAAVAALRQKLPDTTIDVRQGGKLGVAGGAMIGPCVLHQVQEGSAAAQAGIMVGDIVLRIDGQPVANFEALTELVGRHGPGDKIVLDIERGGGVPGVEPQRFKRTVELGGWQ